MSAAQELTRALRGSWRGHYGMACCPAHGDKTPSLSISDGASGRLLLKCHAGCSYPAITAALSTDLRPANTYDARAEDMAALNVARARAERASKQAAAIWAASLPISGTLAEFYLRRRGITCALPPTLRYAPNCWHLSAKRLPALLCKVTVPGGAAIHRTYLTYDGRSKAAVTPAKAMLGQTKGGAVRLSQGAGKLVVAEGVETTLSLMCRLYPGDHSYWAALSASGMAGLALPPSQGQLIVASDGDRPGQDAAERLAQRADALGWQVRLLAAPDGQDWNDVLQARGVPA